MTQPNDVNEIVIRAGPHRRRLCPVRTAVPDGLTPGHWILEEAQTAHRLPAQVSATASGKKELTFLLDDLAAGAERRYRVLPGVMENEGGPQAPGAGVALHDDGQAVAVEIDGQLFTRYHYAACVRPFLYPVIGPFGVSMTRHFPMAEVLAEKRDHPHHRSVWFTHGDVNGVDNWSELAGHGYTRHQRFTPEPSGGLVYGSLRAENAWTDAEDRPLLTNVVELRFYRLPHPHRMLDVLLTFRADRGPVTFGDTKEGGLVSVRVATSMDAERGGRIETGAGGIGEAESWGKRAPWCDYSGPVQTGFGRLWGGISVLDHPSNPRYPTHWHVRAYGLMTANCFGLSHFTGDKAQNGAWDLASGEERSFRYRLYVHPGDAQEGRVKDCWLDFAYPPDARPVTA